MDIVLGQKLGTVYFSSGVFDYLVQANDGPCKTSKPGFFDFAGKMKW